MDRRADDPGRVVARTRRPRLRCRALRCFHDKGETDDHTWTWIPEKRLLCTGDLFIWASPNCGNPQKVQRYPREWAVALREMAALRPEFIVRNVWRLYGGWYEQPRAPAPAAGA